MGCGLIFIFNSPFLVKKKMNARFGKLTWITILSSAPPFALHSTEEKGRNRIRNLCTWKIADIEIKRRLPVNAGLPEMGYILGKSTQNKSKRELFQPFNVYFQPTSITHPANPVIIWKELPHSVALSPAKHVLPIHHDSANYIHSSKAKQVHRDLYCFISSLFHFCLLP